MDETKEEPSSTAEEIVVDVSDTPEPTTNQRFKNTARRRQSAVVRSQGLGSVMFVLAVLSCFLFVIGIISYDPADLEFILLITFASAAAVAFFVLTFYATPILDVVGQCTRRFS
mmetsp:Transcript_11848/g.38959  ORF Transcript_11848/g.38959 Transcript_11848/m.38959 type:complete len:114 (+) Transcript_11848:1715-2056(+)